MFAQWVGGRAVGSGATFTNRVDMISEGDDGGVPAAEWPRSGRLRKVSYPKRNQQQGPESVPGPHRLSLCVSHRRIIESTRALPRPDWSALRRILPGRVPTDSVWLPPLVLPPAERAQKMAPRVPRRVATCPQGSAACMRAPSCRTDLVFIIGAMYSTEMVRTQPAQDSWKDGNPKWRHTWY